MNQRIKMTTSLMLVLAFGFLFFSSQFERAQAQENVPGTSTPFPEMNTYTNAVSFMLKDFNQETIIISYPGSESVYFDLPNRWSIIGDGYSYFELHYDLEDPTYDYDSQTSRNEILPRLEIYINDMYINTFAPEVGKNQIKRIPLPSELLRFPTINNPNNEYEMRFEFTADWDEFCEYVGILTIHDHSLFQLEFSILPPELDLGKYYDAVTQDSFIPETLYFILPDTFNDADLTTATALIGDISQATSGTIQMEFIRASEVTEDLLTSSSFIAIGPPNRNGFTENLFGLNLVAPWLAADQTINYGRTIEDGDGILQVIPNYLNGNYGILVVTGNTDDATYQAAKALTHPMIEMAGEFTIVPEDLEFPDIMQTPYGEQEISFLDLGYRERVFYGTGSQFAFLNFYVPRNWDVQENAEMKLIYAHSSNLSKANSSLKIYLNGRLIGTAPLDPESQGDLEIAIPIQPEYLLPGALNSVRFELLISAPIECALLFSQAFWVTFRDLSILSLPYEEIIETEDLPPFIHPLYYLAYEDSPLVILLPEEPGELDLYSLTKITQFLSGLAPRPPQVTVLRDPVPLSSFTDENVLVIGKPSEHLIIRDLNHLLPQPFNPEGDLPLERVGTIPYQISADIDMGIVETLPSPWNALNGITVITGTSDTGARWSVDLLSSDEFIYDFFGDVFFVYGDKITAFQSETPRRDTLDEIVSELTQESVVLETVDPTATPVSGLEAVSQGDRYDRPDQNKEGFSQAGRVLGQIILGSIFLAGLVLVVISIRRTILGGRRG